MTSLLEQKCVETIRFLSADTVQKANSGHPGLPMGAAAMAFTIWSRHLRHSPRNPKWIDRDRFVLSGGHGSALLYALLHLSGYQLTLDDLKNFRQWGSKTPGHPEFGHTVGVETTTGPLGQGFANGVGMALAEAKLAAEFNRPSYELVNHYTYAIVTDGDLMEGISSEAASLAGTLKLGKLIYLYDDNQISIEGSTDIAFTEDRMARFASYGWHTQVVSDGNDIDAIDAAIIAAKKDLRPSIIAVRTLIGYGLPNKAGKASAHGEPAGVEELARAKTEAGWNPEVSFLIPEDVASFFLSRTDILEGEHDIWMKLIKTYQTHFSDLATELIRRMRGELPPQWTGELPIYAADAKGVATRIASGKALNQFANQLPEIFGGSADLAPSNKTNLDGMRSIKAGDYSGRNIHFGVREHAMGAIVNGIHYHGGFRSFGATFLVFADYLRPAIRISALSGLPSIWVFTHDSIGVGEDGPTHQPIEQLASLRAIPNLVTIRPCDANESNAAWKTALERTNGPTALIFTRQNLPILDRNIVADASMLEKGAYVLADAGDQEPELILMGSGSEVSLIFEAGLRLAAEGINVRMVSIPSWELFEAQPESYRKEVLPDSIAARVAVEAGINMGWAKYIGEGGQVISIDHFGASAPAEVLFEQYGFTIENVIETAMGVLKK
ncbi:MAG TPA: transketolase [Anaerolineales bacterium]|nr:transketolase [Anaerolineales bacterium]